MILSCVFLIQWQISCPQFPRSLEKYQDSLGYQLELEKLAFLYKTGYYTQLD